MKYERTGMYVFFAGLCLRSPSWHCGLRLHLTGNVFANVCLVHFGWLTHRGLCLSNRPGNLNLLPKQLKGLSAWMEVQIVLHCTLNLCVRRCAPQLWGHVQPHKAAPSKWPIYLRDLAGMFRMFLGGCFHRCVIGWGNSVEVTTETRTLNFSMAWIHHQRPACDFLFRPISVNAPPVFLGGFNSRINDHNCHLSVVVCEQRTFLLCNKGIHTLFCSDFFCLLWRVCLRLFSAQARLQSRKKTCRNITARTPGFSFSLLAPTLKCK